MPRIEILIVVIVLLLGGIGAQQWRVERLAKKSAEWKIAVEQFEAADTKNQLAIKQCGEIAAQNFTEAERQKEAMEIAAKIASDERGVLNERLSRMAGESARLHELLQGDCVVASDPAFIDSLYSRP